MEKIKYLIIKDRVEKHRPIRLTKYSLFEDDKV